MSAELGWPLPQAGSGTAMSLCLQVLWEAGSVPLSALAGRLAADGGGYSVCAVVPAVRSLRNAGAVSVEGTGPRAVVSLARAQDNQVPGGGQ